MRSSVDVPRPLHLGGNFWNLRRLAPVTVLFGKNGSGKSVLLRACRDTNPSEIYYIAPERAGTLRYDHSISESAMRLDILRGSSAENFNHNYRQLVLARIPLFFAARGASMSGGGIGDRREFENYLGDLLPDFTITLHARSPAIEIRRIQSGELVNTFNSGGEQWLSSGEAQTLILALDIATLAGIWHFEGQPSRLVLIDEPDAHMHPDLQVRFADFLTRISRSYDVQFMIATHSVTLLSALGQFGGNRTGVMYMTPGTAELSARQFTAVLKETAACLGGHVLMGALFGAPLLL